MDAEDAEWHFSAPQWYDFSQPDSQQGGEWEHDDYFGKLQ